MAHLIPVLVQTPAHSQIGGALTYRSESPLTPGTLVRVPLGRRETLGVVWDGAAAHDASLDPSRLRPVSTVLDALPPLGPNWRELVTFAARYYQRAPARWPCPHCRRRCAT